MMGFNFLFVAVYVFLLFVVWVLVSYMWAYISRDILFSSSFCINRCIFWLNESFQMRKKKKILILLTIGTPFYSFFEQCTCFKFLYMIYLGKNVI